MVHFTLCGLYQRKPNPRPSATCSLLSPLRSSHESSVSGGGWSRQKAPVPVAHGTRSQLHRASTGSELCAQGPRDALTAHVEKPTQTQGPPPLSC